MTRAYTGEGGWTPRQQKAHRKAWVKALRSGKYQQGKGFLRVESNYCCLGVACDISGLGKWGASKGEPPDYEIEGERPRSVDLPDTVRRWLGFDGEEGQFGNDDFSLAGLNDDGKTFAEIADVIEAEPEGLLETGSAE